MPCYKPGQGIQAPNGALTYYGNIQIASGKVPNNLPPNYRKFALPCGKCTGCRLERSRQTAVRLVHEAQLHKKTSFITLTYRDDALPTAARALAEDGQAARAAVAPGLPLRLGNTTHAETHARVALGKEAASLSKRDLQLFTKRLNQSVRERSGKGVKYYACGEYGDQTHRPHYHIAVFGEDFSDDRSPWKRSNGHQLWRSSRLARLWPYGDADIGELTFESAAYIARYIMKKITGPMALEHYKRENERGETYWLTPEFNVMSRGGRTGRGIAAEWFDKFKDDVYPHDHVISRGHPAKPPRYYDKLLEKIDPYLLAYLKEQREKAAEQHAADNTPARLEARETVALAKLNQTKRSLE